MVAGDDGGAGLGHVLPALDVRPEEQSEPGAQKDVLEQPVEHEAPSARHERLHRAYGAAAVHHNALPPTPVPVTGFSPRWTAGRTRFPPRVGRKAHVPGGAPPR